MGTRTEEGTRTYIQYIPLGFGMKHLQAFTSSVARRLIFMLHFEFACRLQERKWELGVESWFWSRGWTSSVTAWMGGYQSEYSRWS
jgi:hypothetical protein